MPEELVKEGVHLGYAKTRRHPRMIEFVGGVKSNIELFDVEKIMVHFERALEFVRSMGKEKRVILWVGTKPAASKAVRTAAEELGHPFVHLRWIGGTITNFKVIRDRISYWQNLLQQQKMGELAKYTKQEQLSIQRDIDRMRRSFEGLSGLNQKPDAFFIVDSNEEKNAVSEARAKGIPVVALMNTDCDPSEVEYPIPGNDNASRSIEYVVKQIEQAYLKGLSEYVEGEN